MLRARSDGRGEDGVVAVTLAVTLAFALFAVIQLSRTTLAAQQIDDRVAVIIGETSPINEDLTNVPLLNETDAIAKQILGAARPLSGQANEILVTARSIDSTVSSIEGNANSINSTVRGIRGTVSTLAPVVDSISAEVVAINGRADRAIGLVAGAQDDLSNVLLQVGIASPAGHSNSNGKTIHGHANAIDCNALIISSSACER